MKSKIAIIIFLTLSFPCFVSAQKPQKPAAQKPTAKKDTTVVRSVTVERDFQPIIQDAGKILISPRETQAQVEKVTPVYADFTTPLKINYTIFALDPQQLVHQPTPVKKGFFRVGAGYPLSTLGDFMYPIINNENNRLDIALHHLGAFEDKTHSKSSASLQFDHLFDNFGIFFGVNGSHDYFNYYGRYLGTESPFILSDAASKYKEAMYQTSNYPAISLYGLSGLPLNETHWRVKAHAGAKSLPQSESVKYLVDLQYGIFQSINVPMRENHLALTGSFEVPFEKNKLGMNVEINNLQYDVKDKAAFNFPETYTVMKFNPYYKMISESGFLKLGVKTGISPNHGKVFTPSPDVEAQWNALKESIALYAGATGDLKINTLSSMYDENRYLSAPLRVEDTYIPLDAFAGIKFKPAYNFLIDLFGNYKIINNQYFFVNRAYTYTGVGGVNLPNNLQTIYQNRFDTVHSRAAQSTVGLRADYNYQNRVNIYVKAAYHSWKLDDKTQQHAWQMPAWDVDFGTSVKVINDVDLSAQFFYQDGRYAKLGNRAVKMAPTIDLNLGASYTYNNWMSFFVKGNNLLNKKYDIQYGYEVYGINVMAGVALSF